VTLDNLLADGQSQAQPFLLGAKERLEDARLIAFGNARPGILERQADFLGHRLADIHHELPPLRTHGVDGVDADVHAHLLDLIGDGSEREGILFGMQLPVDICISPNTDPGCSGASIQKNRFRDALLSPTFLRTLMKLHREEHDLSDPLLTPLYADLQGLPSIFIQVGEDELLLDDAKRFANCAKAAGVPVTLEIWPNMWHVWHYCTPDLSEANQAIEHITKYILTMQY
jgi:hypothetical protein